MSLMKTLSLRSTVVRGLALVLALLAGVGHGVAQTLPAGAVDRGPVAAATRVHATLYLSPEAARTAALVQFLRDVETPGSTSYHQWISATDFVTKFGASETQVARVRAFVESGGLKVESVSGLRMRISGSAGAVEAVFSPGLHRVMLAEKEYMAATASVVVPVAISADVVRVGGMDTLPGVNPLALTADGVAVAAGKHGSLEDLTDAVELNTARIFTLSGTSCEADFASDERTVWQSILREAAAQGQSVLAASACATPSGVSFPAVLPEVTSVVIEPAAELGVAEFARPVWQNAVGLPADALRHEPDLMTADLGALTATFVGILSKMPAGSRLGNVGESLYEIAPEKGLFTQPDASTTGLSGNWEAPTGLGLVDLTALDQHYPRGSAATYITVTTNPSFATHGSSITFSAAVKDISGSGTAPPTGTISFSTDTGIYLGTNTLTANGTVSSQTSITNNQLAAGGYNVVATYSGDSFYAENKNQTFFNIGPEEGVLAASVASAVPLGGTIQVTITDTSAEGVGTPKVTGYVIPQGIANPGTSTVPLTGTGGVASGQVSIPATQAGSLTLLVGCTSNDPSFTCYNSINITATVNKATPTMTLSVVPVTPTANVNPVFTAQVTGLAGQVVPTGVVIFFDNGVNIGQNGLDNTGKCVFTGQPLDTTKSHSFTATYYGDSNYVGASASTAVTGSVATTTAVTINPNPPVAGSTTTITATVSDAGYTGTATVGGTVTFVIDGSAASTNNVTGGVSTYTTTGLNGTSSHTVQALYSGDANFASSNSPTVTTPSSVGAATTTTVTVSPNPPVLGSTTTVTATIAHPTGTNNPGGTAQFYIDGVLTSTVSLVNSVATYTSATISGATAHTFYAVYLGDGTYAGSTSPTVTTTTTGKVTTTTTLSVSPNPPSGPSTTLVAVVAPVNYSGSTIPTGTVTFYDGQTVLSQQQVLGNGSAIYAATISGTVSHAFSAVYSGDTTFGTSTSSTVNTAGTSVATTTAMTVSPNPPVSGSTTTLTAKVSQGTGGGTALPSGTMAFYMDGVALTTTATVLSGNASYSSTSISGTTAHSFYAVYSGDTIFGASTSPAVATAGSTTGTSVTSTSVTVNPNPPVSGKTTTLTAKIAYTPVGTAIPTGTVVFTQDGVALSPTSVVTTGTATATYTSTVLSGSTAHVYAATYSGDSVYAGSAAPTVTTPAAATGTVASATTLKGSAATTIVGTAVGYTVTVVSGSASSTVVPTGTVTLTNAAGTVLGSAVLNASGVASIPYTPTTNGTVLITATYSGDAVYAASASSPPVSLIVGATTLPVGILTLQLAPTSIPFGGSLTANAAVTGTTSDGVGPTGSVSFAVTSTVGGGAVGSYASALTPVSTTMSTASATITGGTPGTYTVTATCATTNISCSATAALGFIVTKGTDSITLTASPNPPVAGQSTVLTATIAPTYGGTGNFTGYVTFYVNGVAIGSSAVNGNVATYTTTLPGRPTTRSMRCTRAMQTGCRPLHLPFRSRFHRRRPRPCSARRRQRRCREATWC